MLSESPVARTSDPITSKIAAQQIKKLRTVQQQEVLYMIRVYPGSTSAELAVHLGTDRFMPARRLPELAPKFVRRGSPRHCSITGKLCLTWYPA